MRSLEEVRGLLGEHRAQVRDLRVTEMLVFGSYARREQRAGSDVDILIRYEKAPTLWMLGELREYLSEGLGMPVDVVTEKGLKLQIRERVLVEAVRV